MRAPLQISLPIPPSRAGNALSKFHLFVLRAFSALVVLFSALRLAAQISVPAASSSALEAYLRERIAR